MGAQQNGTFYSNAIKDLDEVAQSTGRTLVTGKRKDVRAELKRRRDEYLKRGASRETRELKSRCESGRRSLLKC